MAKDTICLNYDECYASQSSSDESESDSDSESMEEYQDEDNYSMVFGYNIKNDASSHALSMEDQNDDIMMGGILSLNRESTSFIQQLYLKNSNSVQNQFAHYFNQENGYLAIGDAVDRLLDLLSIENNDLTWIPYYNQETSSMYQVRLEQIELDNTLGNENIYSGEETEHLDILTFDTAISGIAMNEIWQDQVLTFIQNTSDVALIENKYYPYCIDTDYDDVLDDIFNKLPQIKISLSTSNLGYEFIISPEQYVVEINNHSIDYRFCLDIRFDWDDGVCLGSLAMNDYIVIYNEDTESVGIYDKNLHHQRQQNNIQNYDSLDLGEQEKKYIYALSLALVAVLICLLCVSGICVYLLKRTNKQTEDETGYGISTWNQRRKSVTIDGRLSPRANVSLSPEHVAMNSKLSHKLELDKRNSSVKKSNSKSGSDNKSRHEINVSMSSSVSPFGSYYDGNIKSIVYDRIIQPWSLEDDMDAI
eukprot:CAMPEP_0201567234 /NCGR_PEP_ID=MMETSP0190_2-20130828/7633_1 /ASSEMBLY_ACC=CAM_ASM_000263 /TAXON_ID=37353 /ORGANISM="Rosalina sp." /LENGTH=475 /DNA_ID=CAMNT_0047986983 /DNA_START=392 /DNA_END=1819 /DNA_ORIENTATION=-